MSYVIISFLFHDPATTEIYTLSLHDALPIYLGVPVAHVGAARDGRRERLDVRRLDRGGRGGAHGGAAHRPSPGRSEEHTSELQSLRHLVCRLLLEKKKNKHKL